MVTFTIIEELNKSVAAYETGAYKGNSLWLADDAVLIANSEATLEKALNVLEIEGEKNGLEFNEEKTRIHPVPCYYASCKFNVNKNIIISQSFNDKYK